MYWLRPVEEGEQPAETDDRRPELCAAVVIGLAIYKLACCGCRGGRTGVGVNVPVWAAVRLRQVEIFL